MFLVKTQYRRRDNNDILSVETIHPRFLEKRKRVLDKSMPGMPFYRSEHAGVDHSKLDIRVAASQRSNGTNNGSPNSVTCANTAAGLKTCVRRLRPEEAKEIDAIDAEISRLRDEIRKLRAERSETVKAAWSKAHVVRLNELDIKEP